MRLTTTPLPRSFAGALLGGALLLAAAPAGAGWSFEMHWGRPWTPDRDLHISQSGQPDLDFDAHMRSEPGRMPLYYDFRLIRWCGRRGWAFDFLHHKLILDDNPPEVQDFQLTHGYNMISLQRLWDVRGATLMAGGGAVLTHAESTIRGKEFDQHRGLFGWGYYVSGPLAVVGVGKRLGLGDRLYLSGDLRASWSHVRVPVADGHASMADFGLHFLAGAGFRF